MIWLKSGRFFPSNPPWHRHKKGQHHTIYITTNICLLGTVNRGKFADKGMKEGIIKKDFIAKALFKNNAENAIYYLFRTLYSNNIVVPHIHIYSYKIHIFFVLNI